MKAFRLACSFRGKAQSELTEMTPSHRAGYDQLMSALTNRSEPENLCDIYKCRMKQRVRKRSESFTELAHYIRLTRMAHPPAVLDLRELLSKYCFIDALNDADMEMFIPLKEPETLKDTVRAALKYEAVVQSRPIKLRTSSPDVHVRQISTNFNQN